MAVPFENIVVEGRDLILERRGKSVPAKIRGDIAYAQFLLPGCSLGKG